MARLLLGFEFKAFSWNARQMWREGGGEKWNETKFWQKNKEGGFDWRKSKISPEEIIWLFAAKICTLLTGARKWNIFWQSSRSIPVNGISCFSFQKNRHSFLQPNRGKYFKDKRINVTFNWSKTSLVRKIGSNQKQQWRYIWRQMGIRAVSRCQLSTFFRVVSNTNKINSRCGHFSIKILAK